MINIEKIKKILDEQIRYEENGHKYFRVSDGKLLAGVSSVSELAKSKDSGNFLAQWKVNECIEYIKNNSKKIPYEGSKDFFYEVDEETLKDSKYAHTEKGKEATDLGTVIHSILEEYVKARIKGKEFDWQNRGDVIDLFAESLIAWEKENKVEWLACELLVGDLENDVAGRLDALAYVNGKLTIIDFKSSNSIPPSYYIQLAGYSLCLSAMGIECEDRMIIRLPKTNKRKVWIEETRQYKMVDNVIEFIRPKTNYEFDKKIFIACREIYRWINQLILN